MTSLGIRWTVGDVSSRGWEALRLSVHCAVQFFGPQARYVICVNTVPLALAQERTGALPEGITWRMVSLRDIPRALQPHLDPHMAEGVGWKLIPPRLFPDIHELSLDNDCILWSLPPSLSHFLDRSDATLLAEDIERCLGQFGDATVPGAINSGIRGLPPGFALIDELAAALAEKQATTGHPILLHSELDEQGLQAVALHRISPCLRVSTQEVSICSPFWPRQPELGTCGAHFVGLNSKHIPWNYYDEPGDLVRRRHWDAHRRELYSRAGLPLTPPLPLDSA
jgi:hypothetical protein